MNIWYLHHYATPYEIAGLHRPFEFGKYFNSAGNKTTVFSSSFLHYASTNLIEDNSKYLEQNYDGIDTVFIRTSGYGNSGVKRILNMLQFGIRLPKAAKVHALKTEKPDVIIASSPHPFTMLAGLIIAKSFSIPCICEVRDFWPEVFFTSGKLKESSILGRILLAVEKYIYTKADGITFLKEGDYTYLTDKKWDICHGGKIDMAKCIYVNNGVDIGLFDKRIAEHPFIDSDLCSNKYTIVYCGTIRPVNDIDLILDTAKLLGNGYSFLIFGTGNCVDALQKRINDEHIENVKLKGYVDNQYIPSILSQSSLNLLNYSGTAYNWSRGNSSNKLFEYLASGKPVVSTVKMGYDIIERYKCGASVAHTSPEEIAAQIRMIKELDNSSYTQMCKNARAAAADFDIHTLATKYLHEIERIASREKLSKMLSIKSAAVFGHFGYGQNLLNGQTIKTKIVTEELQRQLGEDQVVCIDTHGGLKTLLRAPFQAISALKSSKNILIFPAQNGLRVYAPLLAFFRTFFRERGLHYVVIGGWLPQFLSKRKLLTGTLKRFDGIYVETNTMKSALEANGFRNIFLMPNCKPLAVLSEDELVYPTGTPYRLCTFSRVCKEKGIEDAVHAVASVNETLGYTAYTLDIYGQVDSGQTEWFEQLQASFPNYISYCGLVPFDESTNVLKHYFALIFPTYYDGEGFAGTLIDALSAGIPVIASDWKYNPEIVNEHVGCLYPAKDVAALAAVLKDVSHDPSIIIEMKKSCLEESKKYKLETVVRDLLNHLKV